MSGWQPSINRSTAVSLIGDIEQYLAAGRRDGWPEHALGQLEILREECQKRLDPFDSAFFQSVFWWGIERHEIRRRIEERRKNTKISRNPRRGKLPCADDLRTELSDIMREQGATETEARLIIQTRYPNVSRQAINKKLRTEPTT